MKQEGFSTPARPRERRRDNRRVAPPSTAGWSGSATVATPAPAPTKITRLVTTKLITPRPPSTDPRVLERQRLLEGLLVAQGRSAVTRAVDAFFAAGHTLPSEQAPWLQVLEHADESRVCEAIAALDELFAKGVAPERRPVLEQRLHRLADMADEPATREAAAALIRKLH